MSERVDWPHLMRLGLGVMRIPATAFWDMTPPELLAALQGAGVIPMSGGGPGMTRDGLAALMARFPDTGQERSRDGTL